MVRAPLVVSMAVLAAMHSPGAATAAHDVTRLSRLGSIEDRRKAIVAIAAPGIVDVPEPTTGTQSLIWPYWMNAVAATSRANASVYAIDPRGLTGRVIANDTGIVAQTGGFSAYNSNDFEAAVDRIWREAGHYYLLEYTSHSPYLHRIEVRVAGRPDVKTRAGRSRG